MLPTQLFQNHAPDIQGPELDELLVCLYQTCRINYEDGDHRTFHKLSFEQRMEHFRTWFRNMMAQAQPKTNNMKIQRVFQKELPELRSVWKEVMG